MGTTRTGVRRRVRLLGEALRPPRRPVTQLSKPADTTTTAQSTEPAKPAKRPPKKTVSFTASVPTAPRLVESPVFVLTPVRSGSTLLRMLLNSHSRIRAPHELHLRTVEVELTPDFSEQSMRQLDLDKTELEHVLWDRVLHLQLEASGKDVIVDKTPGNVWTWRRLQYAWPNARFLILLRHPQGIVTSLASRKGNTASTEDLDRNVLKYAVPLEEARQTLDGDTCHTVRYEELTTDPERVTQEICDWLDQKWEPGMLEYGEQDHGPLLKNLGDRSDNIKSGRIQPARSFSGLDELSPRLREIAAAWGYGD